MSVPSRIPFGIIQQRTHPKVPRQPREETFTELRQSDRQRCRRRGGFWELGLSLDEIECEELDDFSASVGSPSCPSSAVIGAPRIHALPLRQFHGVHRHGLSLPGGLGEKSALTLTMVGMSHAKDG